MTMEMSRGEGECNRLIMWPRALRRRESEEDETNRQRSSERVNEKKRAAGCRGRTKTRKSRHE